MFKGGPELSFSLRISSPNTPSNSWWGQNLFYIKSVNVPTAVLVIQIRNRIRIRMFLGLPDPDPLVKSTDPDPDPSLFS